MKAVAIIQARVGSSRLPAKALLPVCGIPVAILAAKRAQRNGLEVRVATSIDSSDDILVHMLQEAGLRVFRGPSDDVLSRFVQATDDLPDNATVVRLTGDNTFPDADFVDIVVQQFLSNNHTRLVATTQDSHLPYGLSAEAFRCGMLREAARKAVTPYQREHVTPWIRSTYGVESVRVPCGTDGWQNLRCTIDTLEDYERVWKVFQAGGGDPISISWRTLCEILARDANMSASRVPVREINGEPYSVLILGTAQLGMNYGIANITGHPSESESVRILKKAVEIGVTHVDTARAYGDSERRIGLVLESGYRSALRVITKLDPLSFLPPDASQVWVKAAVDASVFRSCRELCVPHLDVLLVHRAAHLSSHSGAIWQRLCELRDQGVIRQLGVSVQSVDEAKQALADPNIRYLQLPFNILDRRWLGADFQKSLRSRPDVIVLARSALLQGLLTIEDPALWPRVSGANPRFILSQLHSLVHRLQRRDVIDLALAYVRGQEWIHSIVLGVEKVEQLVDAAQLVSTPPLTPEECRLVEEAIAGGPEALVNPALWPSNK